MSLTRWNLEPTSKFLFLVLLRERLEAAILPLFACCFLECTIHQLPFQAQSRNSARRSPSGTHSSHSSLYFPDWPGVAICTTQARDRANGNAASCHFVFSFLYFNLLGPMANQHRTLLHNNCELSLHMSSQDGLHMLSAGGTRLAPWQLMRHVIIIVIIAALFH